MERWRGRGRDRMIPTLPILALLFPSKGDQKGKERRERGGGSEGRREGKHIRETTVTGYAGPDRSHDEAGLDPGKYN